MSKFSISALVTGTILIGIVIFLVACPGKLTPSRPFTDSPAITEIAEAVISGAVQSTSPTNLQARYIPKTPRAQNIAKLVSDALRLLPKAQAAYSQGQCPTYQQGWFSAVPNTACSVGATTIGQQLLNISWGPCNMAQPYGTWSGGEVYILTQSPGETSFANSVNCTGIAFQSGDVVLRYFYSPTARIPNFGSVENEEANYPTVLVDTVASTSSTLPAANTGYGNPVVLPVNSQGEYVNFNGPVQRTIDIYGIHVVGSVGGYITWNYSLTTFQAGTTGAAYNSPGSIQPNALSVDATNTLQSGTVYVSDNLNQRVVKTVVQGPVQYNGSCGVPVGTGGFQSTLVSGAAFSTETLTGFTACGTSTLNGSTYFLSHSF